jgi:hypothetical protein
MEEYATAVHPDSRRLILTEAATDLTSGKEYPAEILKIVFASSNKVKG